MSNIYKVKFKEPTNGEIEHYFGSLKAIYDTFTADQIGCKVSNLWNVGVSKGTPYISPKCEISLHNLTRKQTNRGQGRKNK